MTPNRVRVLGVIITVVAFFVVAGFVFAGQAANAESASTRVPPAQLSVVPDALALAPRENEEVLVIASFPVSLGIVPVVSVTADLTATAMSTGTAMTTTGAATTGAAVTLSYLNSTGAQIVLPADITQPVPAAGGDVTWRVAITAGASGVMPGTIYFVASYQAPGAGALAPTLTVTGTLSISRRASEVLTSVLSATLHSDIKTLLDQRQRNAFLVLTNISDVPVYITRIVPQLTSAHPEQLGVSLVDQVRQPVKLLPQQAKMFPIKVQAESQIEPGSNLLLVRASAQWQRGQQQQQGTVVVTTNFESGVFGESAILTAIGIPALFFLPGFILVVGFLFFSQVFSRVISTLQHRSDPGTEGSKWGDLPAELGLARPHVWFTAITFSLILYLFYPQISPRVGWLLGQPSLARNLLIGYGFIDIAYLWFSAFVVALIGAALAILLIPGWKWLLHRYRERSTPSGIDDGLTILRKLIRKGSADFKVKRRDYAGAAVYVLPESNHTADMTWVSPRIKVAEGQEYEGLSDNEKEMFKNDFTRAITAIENGEAKLGYSRLESWQKDKWLRLDYGRAGNLAQPTQVKTADLGPERPEAESILNTTTMFA